MAQFKLDELVEGYGVIQPAEGAGADYPYFSAHRLCDASTTVTAETFSILRENTARDKKFIAPGGGEKPLAPEARDALLQHADRLASGRPGADFAAVQAKLTALTAEEAPHYLAEQAPGFFKPFPAGSWWFVRVDHLLVHRLALLRALLAMELTPDLIDQNDPVNRVPPGLFALQEHSLTSASTSAPRLIRCCSHSPVPRSATRSAGCRTRSSSSPE